ncbi:MAG: DNA-binding domain-containing protein [Myxococcota bacterium]
MSATSPVTNNPYLSLREQQAEFLAGLLDPRTGVPSSVQAQEGLGREARFDIYRTAYRQRLKGVLRSDHPAVAHVVDCRFDRLADAYIDATPSTWHSLRNFGDEFPKFLTTTDLPDSMAVAALAGFERSLLDAFDAPDAPRRGSSDLLAVGADGRSLSGIVLHPSVRRIAPGFNVVEQWHAYQEGRPPVPWVGQRTAWALWRGTDRRTSFRALSPFEAMLLPRVLVGDSLAEQCEALADIYEPTQIPPLVASALRRWLAEGWVSELLSEPAD